MNKDVKVAVIARFYGIEIEDPLDYSVEFEANVWITNNKNFVHSFLNEEVKKWVGEAEYRHLYHSKAWYISEGLTNESTIQFNSTYQKIFDKISIHLIDCLYASGEPALICDEQPS